MESNRTHGPIRKSKLASSWWARASSPYALEAQTSSAPGWARPCRTVVGCVIGCLNDNCVAGCLTRGGGVVPPWHMHEERHEEVLVTESPRTNSVGR